VYDHDLTISPSGSSASTFRKGSSISLNMPPALLTTRHSKR
jgi:hypothetical protein